MTISSDNLPNARAFTPIDAASSPAPSQLRAALHLDFQTRPLPDSQPSSAGSRTIGSRTIVKVTLQEPPLKVVRAFDPGDGSALVHLHNVSGGLLGGDQLCLKAHLAPATRVQLTTTGATRLYRPRYTAAPATQTAQIFIAKDALLEYLPDALIPFAGSRYSQQTAIQLAEGAGLFWWEVVAPGREARGELFEYERLEIGAEIFAESKPIVIDRVQLEPKLQNVAALGRLSHWRTWATFYICRVGESAATWRSLEQELRGVAAEFGRSGETIWGISSLVAHGISVRALAKNGRGIHSGLHALWRAAKWKLYGSDARPPRKVH